MTTAPDGITEYDTAGPARIDVDLDFGGVRLLATAGSTTRVTVRPSTTNRRADTELAASTRVEFVGGVVSIAASRRHSLGSVFRPGAVEILIEAPVGSSVRANTGYAHIVAEGRLGRCHVRSSYGDVRLGEVDEVSIKTSGGHVSVGLVHRAATISGSYANIQVGEARGDGDLRNSAGDVSVGTCRDTLGIRTAYGQVNVENAVSGSLDVVTSYGSTDVGVAAGTAVRLDVLTKNGHVVNALTPADAQPDAASTLGLRVRSGWGDVTIHRTPRPEGESR